MIAQTDYSVRMIATDKIFPSPENDDIYGAIVHDEQMENLIDSIREFGLEEPIIVTADNYILSGHRRYYACDWLGMESIPIRKKKKTKRIGNSEFTRLLIAYNPQRNKTARTLLKEALLRFSTDDPTDLLKRHEANEIDVEAEFTIVAGGKSIRNISPSKQEFLAAAKKVIASLQPFWPLSVRQVHYALLNKPPLISKPKKSKFKKEYYRYRNDKTSYNALIELLTQARYLNEVSMSAIDDPTRPSFRNRGFFSVAEFIEREMKGFLTGYHRDMQRDQPRHIEMLGEKNTLLQILKPVCEEFYVPLTLARGYASIPVWRDMAQRFANSEKTAMTLVVVSDYDPEGFDLADDAIRSLRDLWGVPVEYCRVGVNREQIDELGLNADFNPAKETSSRLKGFIDRTGGKETWEVESLDPHYLQAEVRNAITANMDMDVYRDNVEQQDSDAEELSEFRRQMVDELGL